MTLSLPPAKFAKLQDTVGRMSQATAFAKDSGAPCWLVCNGYASVIFISGHFYPCYIRDLSHGGLTPRWMTRAQVESFLAKVTSDDSLTLGVNMPPFFGGLPHSEAGSICSDNKNPSVARLAHLYSRLDFNV